MCLNARMTHPSNLSNKAHCVLVCVCSLSGQNCWTHRATLRHGGPHLPWEVILYALYSYPNPLGQAALKLGPRVTKALTLHFWEFFIKQTLQNAPNLVAMGLVRSGPRPHPSIWRQVQVPQARYLGHLGLKFAGRWGTTQGRSMLRS